MTSTSAPYSTSAERAIADVYSSDWGRLLSLLVTRSRRLDLAEDALGEAFARAASVWPTQGVPESPAGWMYTTAWRQVLGQLRAEAIHGRKAPLLATSEHWVDAPGTDELGDLDDDRLALILLCCHPALQPHARSPLALRLILGTPTSEIARLFLVSQATMAARLTRAKKKIVVAGIPLAEPADQELRLRLDDVCRTIYLAFTAGYTPGQGQDLLRSDLAGDAVRLAAILHRLVPAASQVQALLSLLILQHARRKARVANGALVTLSEQDRSLWQVAEIDKGLRLLDGVAVESGYAEELRLQACIAAEHGRARSAADTDWHAIARHYRQLEHLTGSPVVRLNRAVAVAQVSGPQQALVMLENLEEHLPRSHRLFAVRAQFARDAGDITRADRAYARAIELCTNQVETDHLRQRLASLRTARDSG